MKSKPARGLQDIRTISERTSDADNPQRKYLSLAMLELEKVRRNKEKQSASQRVENIDRRVAEIEEEQASLLAAAEAELAESSLASRRSGTPDPKSQAERGFKLTY
ncbi:MAG: hypothetical protein A2V70_02725 [Planctomycetes bacterium RBG_13_63_9]|nr:MAG: hypothetical protein A2V70_02725 [Planctomycetes bacterium RBG_13_63_9]